MYSLHPLGAQSTVSVLMFYIYAQLVLGATLLTRKYPIWG